MPNIQADNIISANIVNDENIIKGNVIQKNITITAKTTTTPSATTETKGIIRIATDGEAIEGISDNTAITPKTLKLATSYVHSQGIASDVWTIQHNLNKKPSIMVVDSAGNVVEGAEQYIDENTIEIYFNGAFKGEAYLN